MNPLQRLVSVLLLGLLVACQSVPIYDSQEKPFASAAKKDTGMIRIASFQIPKDEPVVSFLLFLGSISGAKMDQPVSASLFDVTEGTTGYIGTLSVFDPLSSRRQWIEAEVQAGKRTLMLTLAGARSSLFVEGFPAHADFIDVDVPAGGVSHVVLSRHGFARHPYFGEVAISTAHRDQCLAITGTYPERVRQVEAYMAAEQISKYAHDFKNFCVLLSGTKVIQTPNTEALKRFAEASQRIESFRSEQYPKWQHDGEKHVAYDLMHRYEPREIDRP